VIAPVDGQLFERGDIYVAVPDHHVLLGPGSKLLVRRGPYENRTQPAINALFRSVAIAYGVRPFVRTGVKSCKLRSAVTDRH
jgi:two-component system chemotaxis response regulator CheB